MSEGRGLRRSLGWLVFTALLAAVVWAVCWRLTGGQWERVKTPSMGTVAPVGTLLWVRPVAFRALRVGDFITFHPPTHPGLTYSHRVYALNADGTISTKGVLTAPDPWHLSASNIVGRVEMRWWGVGWLIQAAPVLLIGGVLLWLLVWRAVARSWRLPVAIVGVAVILCLTIVIYRPLLRAEQLSFRPVAGGARATYVSTGLLPLRLEALHGGHVDLRDGAAGSVLARHTDSQGRYPVTLHPHISLWWWLAVVIGCFLPAVWTLVVGLPPQRPPRHLAAEEAEAPEAALA